MVDPAFQERRRTRRDELQAAHIPRPGVLAWLEEAERLGVPVGEDSPDGVAAAVAAGLFAVAVPHGLTADLDLSAADVLASSLDELRLAETMAAAERVRPQR